MTRRWIASAQPTRTSRFPDWRMYISSRWPNRAGVRGFSLERFARRAMTTGDRHGG